MAGRKSKDSRNPAGVLRLVGEIDGAVSGRIQPDQGDPVREAAIEEAVKAIRRLPTTEIIAALPVLVKYARC